MPHSSGRRRERRTTTRRAAEWFAQRVSQSLIEATVPSFDGRRVYLLDGTTLTLAPEPALRRAFPPATNQYGAGVWPLTLVVVIHDLFAQLPDDGIVMADAGFGIFAVAWEAWLMKRDFVFRMTDSRFQALFLVTSLPHSADALSDLYLKRGDIEIDISNLKVVLNTERQTARSVEMFPKELLTSLVAYNLVTQFRRQAAPTAPLNAKPIPDDQSPTNSKNVNPNSPLINQIPKVSAIAR